MNGIEIRQVFKRYGAVQALSNVNICFGEQKIYGLLGRNGAGKSTLLNVAANRIFADGGEVLVDGERAAENDRALSKLYLMSEKTYYPENMKVGTAFRWAKNFYQEFDEEYARNLAGSFVLNTSSRISALSTGYLSIFKLVMALSVNVPYVLLDEPVLGLDANHRELFYRILLAKYGEKPFTVVLSTHLIEEVASIIEDVVILKEGKVIRNESREELLSKGYTVSGGARAVEDYLRGREVLGVDAIGGLRTAYVLGKPDRSNPELEFSGLDLQKLFIQLTGM